MKKNCIQHIIIHTPDNMDFYSLSNKINAFHVEVVERKLSNSNLTVKEKITVIDKILENLKSREHEGIIK